MGYGSLLSTAERTCHTYLPFIRDMYVYMHVHMQLHKHTHTNVRMHTGVYVLYKCTYTQFSHTQRGSLHRRERKPWAIVENRSAGRALLGSPHAGNAFSRPSYKRKRTKCRDIYSHPASIFQCHCTELVQILRSISLVINTTSLGRFDGVLLGQPITMLYSPVYFMADC